MCVYKIRKKGWRYDFLYKGIRYQSVWYATKREAEQSKAMKREEVKNPKPVVKIQTDMVFLELVNKRLDYLKLYKSERHYIDSVNYGKRWIKRWGNMLCSEITRDMIETLIKERKRISNNTANMEIRLLRATFNFGRKRGYVVNNPCEHIDFLPVEKNARKYIPSSEEIDKVIENADPDTQDYLWTIRETMARVNEINRLTWNDVDFKNRYVILKTRKKKGGNLTPRTVPMTNKLYEILSRRFNVKDKMDSLVFSHRYFSRKQGDFVVGAYQQRKRLMKSLCKKAGVKHFGFHAFRHAGASIMDNANVPIGSIQRILGHENRSTTEIYLHSIGNSEREAMKIYEQIRQNSLTNSLTGLETENVFH